MKPHYFFDIARLIVQPVSAWQNGGLQSEWKPHVGTLSDGFTEKRRRRDSDNRKHASPDRDVSSEDIGAAAEAALPEVIADYRVGRSGVINFVEGLPQQGRHAQG